MQRYHRVKWRTWSEVCFACSFLVYCAEVQRAVESGVHSSVYPTRGGFSLLNTVNTSLNKRELIVREIYDTEKNYIESLDVCIQVTIQHGVCVCAECVQFFLQPLRKAVDQGRAIIPQQNIDQVFLNMEDVVQVNRVLFRSLEERLTQWSNTQRIGDVFADMSPYLKVYIEYTKSQDDVFKALDKCEGKEAFQRFLRERGEIAEVRGLELRSYLIMPIQRVPRYILLLEELLKHTHEQPRPHPDRESIVRALQLIRDAAAEINEGIRDAQASKRMIEIQSKIPDRKIIFPERKHIIDGALSKVCRKSVKTRWFFLFNDCLMYGSRVQITGVERFIKVRELELQNVRLQDMGEIDTPGKIRMVNAFRIITPGKSFVVMAETHASKTEWLLNITEACYKLQDSAPGTPRSSEAPVWTPDSEAVVCFVCASAFTLIRRRVIDAHAIPLCRMY
jgi:FYVE/RhoGEF/PH domain-containing protein 5/6